jgi:hypothetical protein
MRHVSALFRALADPSSRHALPRPATGSLEEACATWGALHYALNCLLGWRDVPKGLAWWYRAGSRPECAAHRESATEYFG